MARPPDQCSPARTARFPPDLVPPRVLARRPIPSGNPTPPATPPAAPPNSGATDGARARAYLHTRGLFDDVLRAHNVGYNPTDVWEDHAWWGLPKPDRGTGDQGRKRIWLPRGITFPWYINGGIWRLNVRRPLTPREAAAGEPKYIGPAGFANALYNAAALAPRLGVVPPAVLVEGEIDALTIVQACGDEVAAVATGSTAGSRRGPWVAQLALAPIVLVAFDADTAGDGAAQWWLDILPHALRWRPPLHDVNTLPDPAGRGRLGPPRPRRRPGAASSLRSVVNPFTSERHTHVLNLTITHRSRPSSGPSCAAWCRASAPMPSAELRLFAYLAIFLVLETLDVTPAQIDSVLGVGVTTLLNALVDEGAASALIHVPVFGTVTPDGRIAYTDQAQRWLQEHDHVHQD